MSDKPKDGGKAASGGRAGNKPIPRGAGRSVDTNRPRQPVSGALGRRGSGGSGRIRKGSGGKR